MAKRRSFLLGLLSVILAIIILAGIAIAIVMSLTPRQLGAANTTVSGDYTVESLGFADIKLGRVVKVLGSVLKEPAREKIAPNAYQVSDGTSADAKFQSSTLKLLGTLKYENLLIAPTAFHGAADPLTLSYKEFAYVMSSALNNFYTSALAGLAAQYVQIVDTLKRLRASVEEICFTADGETLLMQTVIKLDVSSYVQDVNKSIPIVNIANTVYCTMVNKVTVDAAGILQQADFVSVAINNKDAQISELLLDALLKLTAENGETAMDSKGVSQYVCLLISQVMQDIGPVGTQNGATFTMGQQGINTQNNNITFKVAATIL